MTRRKRRRTHARRPVPRDTAEVPCGTGAAPSGRDAAASAAIKVAPDAALPAAPKYFRGSLQWGLASLSGILIAAACSLFPLGWLAWIALLPLLWAVDHTRSLSRALWLSWWAGALASFGTIAWMIPLIARFTAAPIPAAFAGHLVLSAYQGLVFLLFGWIVWVGREQLALPMTVVAPIALVASEASVWFLFPYGIEMSQAYYPPVIQVADLLGRYGVAAMLALASAASYDLIDASAAIPARARRCAVAGLLLLGAAFAYGQVRLHVLESRIAAAPLLRIGIVQPNADAVLPGTEQGSAAEQRDARYRKLAELRRASQQLVARGAQLIVWSEVSYPGLYPQDRSEDFPAGDPRAVTTGVEAPLIAGSLTQDRSGHQYNSALVFAQGGSIVGRYDKLILVPFGEYIPEPVNFAWVRRLALGTGPGLLPGRAADPISVPSAANSGAARAGPWRIGMLICYEDVLPNLTRRIGAQHPQLLLNLSDDAWFNSEIESRQHLAMAVYAAVEQRTSLARAVNPGISAIVDPSGRIVAESRFVPVAGRITPPDGLLAVVPLVAQGPNFYTAVGYWFPDLCQLLSLAALLGAIPRPWRWPWQRRAA